VQDRLRIPVLKPGHAPTVIGRGALPAPAQLLGALARYPHLSRRQRLGAARAALALRGLRGGAELDRQNMGEWLARHGQGPRAVAALWDLIALPTLNVPAAEASLELGAFVFREGVLSRADAGDIGFHEGTLGEVIGQAAERTLERAGVRVLRGWRAERVHQTASGFEVHGRAGSSHEPSDGGGDGVSAHAAIVALPHLRAAGLLEPLLGEGTRRWAALGASPIVNLHVVYDREVCGERFAAGVGTPVQYLFDRTRAAGAPAGTQYLAVSLSGAQREMAMSVDQLRERYLPALAELLPRARRAKVEAFLVTREHAATFRAAPGSGALRPDARTAIPGLVLAGTWTSTGWPATLESAVLSGHAAARHALGALTARSEGELLHERARAAAAGGA